MEPKIYTVQLVKDELPSVMVRADGKTFDGRVTGRLNKFATVSIEFGGITVSYEFAWDTVVRSLNTGRALIL